MKKYFLPLVVGSAFVFIIGAWAQEAPAITEEQKQQAIAQAQAMQNQIENECRANPYTCSCDAIPCEDLSEVDNPEAAQAYGRCVTEKNGCESKRQAAIAEIEAAKQRIETACRADVNNCSCESIQNEQGKKECELAIIEAKYRAEKEKQDKIKQCTENIDSCDCSTISNATGREECAKQLTIAKEFKTKLEAACKEDVMNCECGSIENSGGRAQCEEAKAKGMQEAENGVKEALSKCFKDVEACDCAGLGLPEPKYVSFCQIQKTYGLNCKHEGRDCEHLETVDIYPPGMPAWLGKFFAKSYKDYIEKEKANGAKAAAGIIQNCLENSATCQCDKTPTYARAFCEKNKTLQTKCEAGDYDACIILDTTPNLPEGVPAFSYSLLDKLVGSVRNARKNLVMSNAARKVGGMILDCMDNAAKCDCSLAPKGEIKAFCEHKKGLVELCRSKKQYESCFKLDEEAVYPAETPELIKNYIQKNVVPEVNTKKQKIFNEMKKGTVCDKISTLTECKSVYYKK